MADMEFNKWLQMRLTAHGFAVGPIDGDLGSKTLAALKAFEAKHGLTIDGTADPAVVNALRASASAVPPAIMVAIPNRDVVAPYAPTATRPQERWPRQVDCPKFYGPVGTHQTTIDVPFDMCLAWDRGIKLSKMTLHEKVAPSALRVLQKVAEIYSTAERLKLGLNLFGGSLNVRKMRGGNSYSMHSWGIAIDFDPERNQLHTKAPQARLSQDDAVPFWQAWEAEGWLSLGRAAGYDWMHVQAARL